MNFSFKKSSGPLFYTKLAFVIIGIGSTIWFLIRVIPKPSRAAYPCMRASAPFMSAFVLYLIGLVSTVFIFRNNKGKLFLLKGILAIVFFISLLISFKGPVDEAPSTLVASTYFSTNSPDGIAQGIFPGRVAWIYNPSVTNEKMTNWTGDYWFMDKNCSQVLVDSMLTSGIRRMGGKSNISNAWDGIFKYFNQAHGKGKVGYTLGEKFVIKINLTNSCCNSAGSELMDTSPQLVLAILKQLIEVVKVPQADIWIGDSYRLFRDEYWNKCHTVYPDVHYVDGTGRNGREQTKPSAEQLLVFSDGQFTSSIPQHYLDADYLINMPCLKSHDAGGITIAAKNHQGSVLKEGDKPENQSAYYMHYALPNPPNGIQKKDQYRHLVDYMGHEQLGGKTLVYIVDALWAGNNWNGIVEKWQMSPFNNDYPSSLFLSQDAVAIESVCFDFLLKEYSTKPASEKYPYMTGVDDYMKQAADPAYWPVGIEYDPEGDGTLLKSLGVYEHWNNAEDKQYSRNLKSGSGIELMKYSSLSTDNYQSEITTGQIEQTKVEYRLFPNPFAASIRIDVGITQDLNLSIYNVNGQLVFNDIMNKSYIWSGDSNKGSQVANGFYLIKLTERSSGKLVWTEKVCRRIN